MKNVYKFVAHDVPTLESQKETRAYKIMEKLNNGEKLNRLEKDQICSDRSGNVKHMGYCYCFRSYMKRFLVHVKYYGWIETRAFDKMHIRNTLFHYEQIVEIVEIPEK